MEQDLILQSLKGKLVIPGDPITRVLRSLIAGRGTQIIQNPVTGEPWIHSCLLGELVVESKPSSDPQSVTISISVTNKHHPDSEFIPSDGTVVLAQVDRVTNVAAICTVLHANVGGDVRTLVPTSLTTASSLSRTVRGIVRRENVRAAATAKLEDCFRPRDLILARVRHTIRAASSASALPASAAPDNDNDVQVVDADGTGNGNATGVGNGEEAQVTEAGAQSKGSSPAQERQASAPATAAAPNLSATSLRGGAVVLLSTAENELGVVHAVSEAAGAVMVPLSWNEMQCPVSGARERRKVAKIASALHSKTPSHA